MKVTRLYWSISFVCFGTGVRQDQLETVIPHDLSSSVMIVSGSHKSQVNAKKILRLCFTLCDNS